MNRLAPALLTLAVLAWPAHADTIQAAADPWPPFMDESHPENGVAMEIISAAYATQGYEVEWNNVPWARAEEGVRDGSYDILPVTWHTESRSEDLMYSEPYVTNEIRFIQRAGEDFEYDGLDSLEGLTIGTIRDYGYGDEFTEADHFTRDPVSDFITNVRKLVDERVDLAIEDEMVARAHIADEEPDLIDEIDFVDPPFSSSDLHVTSGYANDRHEEYIEAFNKGLEEIQEDGTFDQIMEDNDLQ